MLISRLSRQVFSLLRPCWIRRGKRETVHSSRVLTSGQALCWVLPVPDLFQSSRRIFIWRMKTQRHREVSSLAQGHTVGNVRGVGCSDCIVASPPSIRPESRLQVQAGVSVEMVGRSGGSASTPEKKELWGTQKALWPSFWSQNKRADLCLKALVPGLVNNTTASTVFQAATWPVLSLYSWLVIRFKSLTGL